MFDFLPHLGKSSLCFVECSFSINDSIRCLLDLLWIMSILCRLQLFTGTAQSILILGDCVFLQGELLAEHGQFGSQAADTGVHILDADSSQLELALCKADLLAEGGDCRPALLNGLSGGIPIGLSQRQRTIALADFRLCRLYSSPGAIQINVRLRYSVSSVLSTLFQSSILTGQLFHFRTLGAVFDLQQIEICLGSNGRRVGFAQCCRKGTVLLCS